MGRQAVTTRKRGELPHGSESLEVWSVLSDPWTRLGTIIRSGGRSGTITCEPSDLGELLRRPGLLKVDPMDWLTGWSNGGVACWAKGTAPGAAKTSLLPGKRRGL